MAGKNKASMGSNIVVKSPTKNSSAPKSKAITGATPGGVGNFKKGGMTGKKKC
jgi:hypothetical protein